MPLIVSGSLFVLVVIVLTLILTRFLHGNVIDPVKHIGEVCTVVTGGDFSPRVAVKSADEIGVLGETVNRMVEGLHERFELSKYVSSSTIQSLQNSEKGTNQHMTLFFSDIRGFTSFSEDKTPESVVRILNELLNVQTEIIRSNGGDIDKYVADEIVALFSGENQELNACRSALMIQKELEEHAEDKYGTLHVGIGINSGSVILGRIGSETRADFTVIGDHVNFASRLCSIAAGGKVLISENMHLKIQGSVLVSRPYKVKVKGKKAFQKVFYLEGLVGEE